MRVRLPEIGIGWADIRDVLLCTAMIGLVSFWLFSGSGRDHAGGFRGDPASCGGQVMTCEVAGPEA